jgi:hypothetical protein
VTLKYHSSRGVILIREPCCKFFRFAEKVAHMLLRELASEAD